MTMELITKSLDNIESQLAKFADKADMEAKLGTVSKDTQAAIEAIGIKQRELADEILAIKQRGVDMQEAAPEITSWGKQFVGSDEYKGKLGMIVGGRQFGSIGLEVKNTLTGADANVAPDRKPGVVPGAAPMLTLESLIPALPTASNAIEFTKEASFTNSAAEAAEGIARAESALTWSLVNMPISNVGHWIKISRQLAADNAALAAYVDSRMVYGVNRKVETQLAVGDGTAPNISGIFDSGNYTLHGYLSGALGATLAKFVLIRKVIGDLKVAGYAADAILVNPADWATMETELLTTAAGQVPFKYDDAGMPRLFGLPVVESVGVTADTFAVGAFKQAATIHNRENVVISLSDSDSDNFTKRLVTILAERRLALAVEVPAAIRGGDLTPPAA
jgi:HK97 family phage major capsid protein